MENNKNCFEYIRYEFIRHVLHQRCILYSFTYQKNN